MAISGDRSAADSVQVLLGQALHRQLAIAGGRHALELLEAAVEVGDVAEAGLEADLGHRLVALAQQLAGFAHPQAIDELDETAPGGLLEEAREVGGRHAQVLGDLLLADALCIVLKDVVHRPVDAFDVLLVAQLRGGHGREQLVVLTAGEQLHEDEEVAQAGDPTAAGDPAQQHGGFANQLRVAELDAELRAGEQGLQGLEFGEHGGAAFQHLVGEVDQHVAGFHPFAFLDLADPVVRQPRAGEKQGVGGEVADVVADEHLARTGDDQVQLVFLVEMPAHQWRRETVLTVDQRMAFMVVHQFVGRVGYAGCAGHGVRRSMPRLTTF